MPRIRIKNIPEGFKLEKKSKGGMTGDQSNYQLVTNPVRLQGDQVNRDRDVSTRKSLKSVPRGQANIEAEGGETVLTDLNDDGLFGLYNITGPSHEDGGVPMNLPDQSFIFSRDPSLFLSDEELAEFDMTNSKKGVTPAQVSRKFELNKYYGLIRDPYADEIQVNTAELMRNKNMPELSKLAFIQEAKKDFEDGVPLASFVYLQEQGVNPMQFKQQVEGLSEQAMQAKMLAGLNPQDAQGMLQTTMFKQRAQQAEADRQAQQQLQQNLQMQQAANADIPAQVPMARRGGLVSDDPQFLLNEEVPYFKQTMNNFYNKMSEFMSMVDPSRNSMASQMQRVQQPMRQPMMQQPTPVAKYGRAIRKAQVGTEVEEKYTIEYEGMPPAQRNVTYTKSEVMNALASGALSENMLITRVGDMQSYSPNMHPDFEATDNLPMFQTGDETEDTEFDVSTGTTYVTGSSGDRTGADAQTQITQLENQLDAFFQAIVDGRIQPNEDGTYDLPFTISGGSSARDYKGEGAYNEISTAAKQLIKYYPELEGKVGFVQADGSVSLDNPTDNVRLPQGFDNVFGETFDASQMQDVSLEGDNLNLVANQALAYDRNREAYEKTLLPYIEKAKEKYGIDLDASKFNVGNTMFSYSSAEETANRLGLDYSKIAAGDYSELSEKYDIDFTGSADDMADQAKNFLLDQAQFSTIGTTGTIPGKEGDDDMDLDIDKDLDTDMDLDEDFYIQDINDLRTLAGIRSMRRRGQAYLPPSDDINIDRAYKDYQAQVGAINSQANSIQESLRSFAGPQSFMARFSAGADKLMEAGRRAVSDIQSENVGIFNQGEATQGNLKFRQGALKNQALKKFFDEEETIAEQANQEAMVDLEATNKALNNAITNRATTQALNSLNDYYQIDPTTGGFIVPTGNFKDLDGQVPSQTDQIGQIVDIYNQLNEQGVESDLQSIMKLMGVTDESTAPTRLDRAQEFYENMPAPYTGQGYGMGYNPADAYATYMNMIQGGARRGLEVGPIAPRRATVLPFSVGMTCF